jgi:hypothetical protein
MNKEQKGEQLKNMLDRVYEQLSYAETKNGVLLGVFGAIIAILAGFVVADIPCWLKIYLGIIAGIFLCGMLLCIWSFFPNTSTIEDSPRPNFYFWGDMASFKSPQDFLNKIENCENIDEHILAQCVQVSRIIRRKHRFFVNALHILVAGILPPFWITWGITVIKKVAEQRIKRKEQAPKTQTDRAIKPTDNTEDKGGQ